jgi:glycosyltransferase involved in cell wall biosynthesis
LNKIIQIGIDASNILRGGGRTHLIEILQNLDNISNKNIKIIIWGRKETLNLILDNSRIVKINHKLLEKNLFFRIFWQIFIFTKEVNANNCNIIFIPGGSYIGSFHPRVVMCQNMLPFEWNELKRFGFSFLALKLLILRYIQLRTFAKSDGIIFLSQYAESALKNLLKKSPFESKIIPHGINNKFNSKPKNQKDIIEYSESNPYKIIYISIIDQYKHQWIVVNAISKLRKETGWPIQLELIGPYYKPALSKLKSVINKHDNNLNWIKYNGEMNYKLLQNSLFKADLGIFASSCENMPNILMEKMMAGLPLVCSNKGPMPEFLKENGLYFNPENDDEIFNAVKKIIKSKELREKLALGSYLESINFKWEISANSTFSFLTDIFNNYSKYKNV